MATNSLHSRLKWFCFFWVFIQVQRKSNGLNFDVTATGHSGLLISWGHEVKYRNTKFVFTYKASNNSTTVSDKDTIKTFKKISYDRSQYQISTLIESTLYQINITHFSNGLDSTDITGKYIIEGKTGLKTKSSPQKPDFNWYKTDSKIPCILIIWLPCGKYRKCNKSIPSTHFSLRYRAIESKQWYESSDTSEGTNFLCMFPGRVYEVVVTSINGNLKTNSDIKEVYIKPVSTPVREVETFQLTNASLFISWKPPLYQPRSTDHYLVAYVESKSKHTMFGALNSDDTGIQISRPSQYKNHYEQYKLSGIKADTEYDIFIIPATEDYNFGLEYLFHYTPHLQSSDFPLANPDFKYIVKKDNSDTCDISIMWLPCGQKLECKKTRPGTYFQLKIKDINKDKIVVEETITDKDYVSIGSIHKFKNYEITIQSIDGADSKKVTKKIKLGPHCLENE